ncbi:hypothetical protein AVEN_92241-1 [Araneus ventricosus]|uniref:Uncharacterized protein n=1 Tax=Araneus ventricosus TaxID=182803 RepID=A0A4Y2AMV1_ARAVE|nr:hypothetical protein AVEN_92241-1 [Araneus ventricosus]
MKIKTFLLYRANSYRILALPTGFGARRSKWCGMTAHSITDRQCEKPVRIGVVWTGRLDIQPVPISITPFGLPDHRSNRREYVHACVWKKIWVA